MKTYSNNRDTNRTRMIIIILVVKKRILIASMNCKNNEKDNNSTAIEAVMIISTENIKNRNRSISRKNPNNLRVTLHPNLNARAQPEALTRHPSPIRTSALARKTNRKRPSSSALHQCRRIHQGHTWFHTEILSN